MTTVRPLLPLPLYLGLHCPYTDFVGIQIANRLYIFPRYSAA